MYVILNKQVVNPTDWLCRSNIGNLVVVVMSKINSWIWQSVVCENKCWGIQWQRRLWLWTCEACNCKSRRTTSRLKSKQGDNNIHDNPCPLTTMPNPYMSLILVTQTQLSGRIKKIAFWMFERPWYIKYGFLNDKKDYILIPNDITPWELNISNQKKETIEEARERQIDNFSNLLNSSTIA